jgi:hypothetical protein
MGRKKKGQSMDVRSLVTQEEEESFVHDGTVLDTGEQVVVRQSGPEAQGTDIDKIAALTQRLASATATLNALVDQCRNVQDRPPDGVESFAESVLQKVFGSEDVVRIAPHPNSFRHSFERRQWDMYAESAARARAETLCKICAGER